MGSLLRFVSGTSQGASPLNDGGARASLLAVVNAALLLASHALHVSDADTLIVLALGNPITVLLFSVWDKIDGLMQAKLGINVAPTPIPVEQSRDAGGKFN